MKETFRFKVIGQFGLLSFSGRQAAKVNNLHEN